MAFHAPNPTPLNICRACRRALLSQSRIQAPFSSATTTTTLTHHPIPSSSSRPFSTSPHPRKTLPHFPPTTTPEYDTLLTTLRTQHFIPPLLSTQHKTLVYNPKNHYLLLNEPGVTITLSDGEEVKLTPMHPHDKASKHRSLRELLGYLSEEDVDEEEMKTRWRCVPGVLSGFQTTGHGVGSEFREELVRRAGERRQLRAILRCMEVAKKTGMTLAEENVARELFWQFHALAVRTDWEGEEFGWVVKRAGDCVWLMERPEHCGLGAGKMRDGQRDMRTDFWLVGALFELLAARAARGNGGEEGAREVKTMAVRLLALEKLEKARVKYEGRPEHELERRIPLWNGLRLGSKIKGMGEVDAGLRSLLKRVDGDVQRLRIEVADAAQGKTRRCLRMLEEMEKSSL